jgi:hypothetical protein
MFVLVLQAPLVLSVPQSLRQLGLMFRIVQVQMKAHETKELWKQNEIVRDAGLPSKSLQRSVAAFEI